MNGTGIQLGSEVRLETDTGDDIFNAQTMLSNVPSSAYAYGKAVAQPFIHPIETAQATANLGAGIGLLGQTEMFHMRLPADRNNPQGRTLSFPQTEFPKLVGDHLYNRYGTWKNALKTLETDPVGVLGDLSAFFTGGGMLATRAGGISQALTNVGKAIDPLQAVSTPFKAATAGVLNIPPVGKAVQDFAESSLLSIVKFSPLKPYKERRADVKTILEKRIKLSGQGLEQTATAIATIGDKIDALIKTNDAQVPVNTVFRTFQDVKKELSGFTPNAGVHLNNIEKWIDKQQAHWAKEGRETVSAAELQQWKVDSYRQINWDAEKGSKLYYESMNLREAAKGAKITLEEMIPELKELNLEQGKYLEIAPALERAVNRIENQNMTNMTDKLLLGGGVSTDVVFGTQGAGTAVAGTVSMLSKPYAQSRLVQYLIDLKNAGMSDIWINNIVLPSLPEIYGITRQTAFEVGKFYQAVEEAINQSPEQTPVEAFNDQARQGLGTNIEQNPLAGMGAGMPF